MLFTTINSHIHALSYYLLQVNETSAYPRSDTVMNTGVFVSVTQVSCPIPGDWKAYVVKVSNNAVNISIDVTLVLIYNPDCLTCDFNTGGCTRNVSVHHIHDAR